jgi:hypothetical protein
MRYIYEMASCVRAWLGSEDEESEESEAAIKFLSLFGFVAHDEYMAIVLCTTTGQILHSMD